MLLGQDNIDEAVHVFYGYTFPRYALHSSLHRTETLAKWISGTLES